MNHGVYFTVVYIRNLNSQIQTSTSVNLVKLIGEPIKKSIPLLAPSSVTPLISRISITT